MKKLADFTEEEVDILIENLSQPWDKLPIENDLHYRAFREFYCRMPQQQRSVVGAYNKYLVSQQKPVAVRANVSWYEWSNKFKWEERSHALDNYLEEETKNYLKHDQYKQLIDFRRRQRDLAGAITDSANLMIDKAFEALKKLNASDLTPRLIPEYIRVAAQVAELAQNAEANAMALNEIVEKLGAEESTLLELIEISGNNMVGVEYIEDDGTEVLRDILSDFDSDDDDGIQI